MHDAHTANCFCCSSHSCLLLASMPLPLEELIRDNGSGLLHFTKARDIQVVPLRYGRNLKGRTLRSCQGTSAHFRTFAWLPVLLRCGSQNCALAPTKSRTFVPAKVRAVGEPRYEQTFRTALIFWCCPPGRSLSAKKFVPLYCKGTGWFWNLCALRLLISYLWYLCLQGPCTDRLRLP